MSPELPLAPSRDNAASACVLVESRRDLPEHIRPCDCDEHDGVCRECGYKITVGPSRTEYGHARATNRDQSMAGGRRDCSHRPSGCDPNGPQAKQTQSSRGESA